MEPVTQSSTPDWREVKRLLEQLYEASDELADHFPGRLFTLDGHLVGSVGEVIAAYMFDLDLTTASTKGIDAFARRDGRAVEIKFTQRRAVAIRHEPFHLIVLYRSKGGPVDVVFNGPGDIAWAACGPVQSNGQRVVSLTRLRELDGAVSEKVRLPLIRPAPI